MKEINQKPIFFDPEKRRSKYVSLITLISISIITLFVSIVCVGIFLKPHLSLPHTFADILPNRHFHPLNLGYSGVINKKHSSMPGIQGVEISAQKQKIYAFGVEWDDTSFASLETNIEKIDAVILEELTLSGNTIQILNPEKMNRTLSFLKGTKKNIEIIPLINNFNGDKNVWDGTGLSLTLKDESTRKKLIESLVNFISSNNFSGLNIDFEEIHTDTFPDYIKFLEELHKALSEIHKTLSVNIPMGNDSFDLEEIEKRVDMIFLMAYDEHWSTAEPGPISSLDWFTDGVKNVLEKKVPRNKLSIIIGNYGYDWTLGKKTSEAKTFQELTTIMKESEENISFDTGSMNPMYSYIDDDNKEHEVWYLDAISAYNQVALLESVGMYSIGLWRLGSEDPSFWNMIHAENFKIAQKDFEDFSYKYDIDYEGSGELYRVENSPKDGKREITISGGLIIDENIITFPVPYTIARYGSTNVKKIAITFDDGPDPVITPKILDILKSKKIPATFFILGENAQENPLLLKRIYNEGHTIGNHSYSHPDITKIGTTRMNFELTMTERIIESIIKRKSIIFRPPYGEDIEPEIPSQVAPLEKSNALGYITVGMKIDPNDWANPGVDKIVSEVLKQVEEGRGNILLLHDSGGERQQTIEALPKIIDILKAKGYSFVDIGGLINQSRDDMMPDITGKENLIIYGESVAFWGMQIIGWIIAILFTIALIFQIFHSIIVLYFSCKQKFHLSPKKKYKENHLSVAVIIPAFNEEKVIEKTLHSLLKSIYRNFSIIVVDDGSTDNTVKVVKEGFGSFSQIQLIEKENSGKGHSMNLALQSTDAEIVIIMDADTIFHPKTIEYLVRHFSDPEVGAVSGNIKVGNRVNFLTNLQAIEYITSQNIDKRAYDALGIITVVPGAVGAWRRSALMELGGFPLDTLAEDSDITIKLLRNGYKVTYDEEALAFTEAPEDWNSFGKQRFRWTFGVLQVTRKHFNMLFDKNSPFLLRFFILPNFILSRVILPIIAPIIDMGVLVILLFHAINYLLYGSYWYILAIGHILLFILIIIVLDFLVGLLALSFEKTEKIHIIKYLLPQKLLYRFFMYKVELKAIWQALHGKYTGWGKLERKNSVD